MFATACRICRSSLGQSMLAMRNVVVDAASTAGLPHPPQLEPLQDVEDEVVCIKVLCVRLQKFAGLARH